MKVFLILIKVFFIGGLLIISNGNLALTETDNREVFFDRYSIWISELFDNGVVVVGYVVNTEWLPESNLDSTINIKK